MVVGVASGEHWESPTVCVSVMLTNDTSSTGVATGKDLIGAGWGIRPPTLEQSNGPLTDAPQGASS